MTKCFLITCLTVLTLISLPWVARSELDIPEGYASKIAADLSTKGTARVLVRFSPAESIAGYERMADRKQDLAMAHSTYLQGLSSKDIKIVSEPRSMPIFAAEVTEKGLSLLRQHPQTRAITYPKRMQLFLSEAVPLVGAQAPQLESLSGDGVTVCLIDTGVDYQHTDLGGCIGPTCKVLGGEDFGYECKPSGDPCVPGEIDCEAGETCAFIEDGDPADDTFSFAPGHGTSMAGAIASTNETHPGVAPSANLVAVKVTGHVGTLIDETSVVEALQWCVAEKDNFSPAIGVISMSFGTDGLILSDPAECDDENAGSAGMVGAAANQSALAGLIALGGSGNDGATSGIASPACASNVISVGASYDADISGEKQFQACTDPDELTEEDGLVCLTNRADVLDLIAPGSEITSLLVGGGLESSPGTGTSQATAIAAGAAALLREKFPTASVGQIKQRLTSSNIEVQDTDPSFPSRSFPRVDLVQASTDADGDLVQDTNDNCIFAENPGQEDANGDGVGDACECGDFSGDGLVNTTDARLIQRCAVGHFPCVELCDVNGDGVCNTTDARIIQRHAVGQIGEETLRCGQKNGFDVEASGISSGATATLLGSADQAEIAPGQTATISVSIDLTDASASVVEGAVQLVGLGSVVELDGSVSFGSTWFGWTNVVGDVIEFSGTSGDSGGVRLVLDIPVKGLASGTLEVRYLDGAISTGDEQEPDVFDDVPVTNTPDSTLTTLSVQ